VELHVAVYSVVVSIFAAQIFPALLPPDAADPPLVPKAEVCPPVEQIDPIRTPRDRGGRRRADASEAVPLGPDLTVPELVLDGTVGRPGEQVHPLLSPGANRRGRGPDSAHVLPLAPVAAVPVGPVDGKVGRSTEDVEGVFPSGDGREGRVDAQVRHLQDLPRLELGSIVLLVEYSIVLAQGKAVGSSFVAGIVVDRRKRDGNARRGNDGSSKIQKFRHLRYFHALRQRYVYFGVQAGIRFSSKKEYRATHVVGDKRDYK